MYKRRSSEDDDVEDDSVERDPNELVTQYYHRFVVAFLIAPRIDLTLAHRARCAPKLYALSRASSQGVATKVS